MYSEQNVGLASQRLYNNLLGYSAIKLAIFLHDEYCNNWSVEFKWSGDDNHAIMS